ncbi:WSC domain-containing protein [Cryptococcus neoformans 125.91]|nr:WSC domain-containing protein [Cryptococcus neoformans var. grubii 125.91]OXG30575.1 WSC domain-containing protein [Cryptococcus neoformans var. grubii Bt15]
MPTMPANFRTSLYALAALAMSGVSLGAPDHWILTHAQTLLLGRVDPIVNPGAISSHVHNVVGASNFNWNPNTPSEQLDAACSSVIVADDKSNYWAPELYYQHANGTFSPILSGTRIYYFTKGDQVRPFPTGLKMISGTAASKNASDTKAFGVKISCDEGEQGYWLPNGTSHPGGCSTIAMATYFPSCGLESGDLDSDDHFSHMAWPQSYNGSILVNDPNGQYCPDSHPIKYPTIFAQFNYYLDDNQPWRNDECTLVLSNGDCSGNTYHADFFNGWEPDVLQAAITECGDGNGVDDDLMACAPLAKSTNESATWDCRLQGPIPAEDVGLWRPIDQLPGCNPLWKSNVATKPTCESTADPNMVGANVYFENLKYRMHIPMAMPSIRNASELEGLIPGLGNIGDSKLRAWRSDGVDQAEITVGTWEEIEAAEAGESNSSSSSTSENETITSFSAAVSASATSEQSGNGIIAVVTASNTSENTFSVNGDSSTVASSSQSTASSVTTSPSGKTCKRRKHGLTARDSVKNHLHKSRLRRQF